MLTPLASLRTGLEVRLDAPAREWLHRALTDAADAPRHAGLTMPPWERHFAEAGRRCGAVPGAPGEPGAAGSPGTAGAAPVPGAGAAEPADLARVLILHAAAPGTEVLTRLYERGSGAERRAVLLALPHLDPPPEPEAALALVEDALRANDNRLIAAALGPYAAAHLEAHQWRQAVLKCLFTGVPVRAVAGLEHRASGDDELARMLADYAHERTAAGRTVPDDLHHVLRLARLAGDPAARTAPAVRTAEEL